MKQRIYNGNSLEFYNEDNSKKGELRISGSDIVINPIDSGGTVIFGEEGSINDIEVGASGTAVDFTFVGGGAITSNGGTLTVGKTGDTVDLSNATIGTITASIFKGGAFLGDGSGLTSVPSTFTHITASGNISASGTITAEDFNVNNDILPITSVVSNLGSTSKYFLNTNTYVVRSGGELQLKTNGDNERARITADGNVGIGTTAPTTALQVAGDISGSGQLFINTGTDTGDILQVKGNNNVFAARLDGSTTSGQSYGLRVRAGTNSVDSGLLVENTSGTDLFKITGEGKVGIGTTSAPASELHVVGDVSASGQIFLQNNKFIKQRLTNGTIVTVFGYDSGNLTRVGANAEIQLGGDIRLNTNISTHVTASKNISSSANIYAQKYYIHGSKETYIGSSDSGDDLLLEAADDIRIRPTDDVLLYGNDDSIYTHFDGANKRVGIGTSEPSEKLHVLSGSIKVESGQFSGANEVFDGYNGYYSFILGKSAKTGRANAMEFFANSNIGNINWNTTGQFNIGNSNSGNVALKTNDLPRLTILSDGVSNFSNEIHSSGSTVVRPGVPAGTAKREMTGAGQTFTVASGYHPFILIEGSDEWMRVTNAGKVGIGTQNPADKLTVQNTNSLVNFGNIQTTFSSSGTSTVPDVLIKDKDNSSTRAALQVQGNNGSQEVLFAASSGHVGIGTVTPGEKLEVVGNISASGTMHSKTAIFIGTDVGATDNLVIKNSAGTKTFSVSNNGAVNINGSQKLVTSDASIELRNNATGLMTLTSAANYGIAFGDSGGETMRINTSTNNVGIGNTAPPEKLTVEGNISASGDITLGANHIGRDGDNYIGFETDNLIKFRVDGATQVKLSNGVFAAQTDSDVDLGSTSTRFKDAYIDSITVTGNVSASGHISGSSIVASNVGSSNVLTTLKAINTNGVAEFGTQSGYSRIISQGTLRYAVSPSIHFWYDSSGNTPMILADNGKLGLGTGTSPAEKLTAQGNISASGNITAGTSDTVVVSGTGIVLNRSNSYIQPAADNSTTLNIGQSSVRWGHVKVDGADFAVLNGGNERMRVASSGKVGIGTTTPGETLTVAGNISASGTVTIDADSANSKLHVGNATGNSGKALTLEDSPSGRFQAFGFDGANSFYTAYAPTFTIGYGESTGAKPTVETIKIKQAGTVEFLSHITASGNISASQFIASDANVGFKGEKFGRDTDNLIDFSTDNKIIFRVENVPEYEMLENVFRPVTTDGAALGDTNHLWSDLFLRTGAVINFNQDDVLLTHSADTLTMTGGTFVAEKAIIASLTVTALTSSIVTSSVIKTEGSNIFGDAESDSHRFTGSLSVSDDIIANNPGGTSRIAVGENQDFDFNHLIMESDGANNKTDFYTVGTGNHMEISTKDVADIILSSNKNLLFKTDNGGTLGGGTTRMFITGSSGNVGIGTASPGGKLDVDGTYGDLKIGDPSIGTRITYYDTTRILMNSADIKFFTNSLTERMTIESNGNVGIGTAGPEAKLTIKSDPGDTNQPTRITNSSTDAHTGLFLNGTGNATSEKYGMQFGGYNEYSIGGIFGVLDSAGGSTSGDITIDFANGTSAGALIEKVRFTHEGNVGIGTTAPATTLHVSGSGAKFLMERSTNDAVIEVKTSTAGAYFNANSATTANYAGMQLQGGGADLWYIGSYGYADFSITDGSKNAGTRHFTVQNTTGNVGIGTTAPSELLHVSGTNDTQIQIQNSSTSHKAGLTLRSFRSSGTHGNSEFYKKDFTTYIDADEDFLIRPNNNSAFKVGASGDISFISSSAGDGAVTTYFHGDASTRRIGIGTATPSFKLHVQSADASDDVVYIHHDNASQSSGDVLKVRSDAGDNAGSALLNTVNNTGTALYVR